MNRKPSVKWQCAAQACTIANMRYFCDQILLNQPSRICKFDAERAKEKPALLASFDLLVQSVGEGHRLVQFFSHLAMTERTSKGRRWMESNNFPRIFAVREVARRRREKKATHPQVGSSHSILDLDTQHKITSGTVITGTLDSVSSILTASYLANCDNGLRHVQTVRVGYFYHDDWLAECGKEHLTYFDFVV